MASLLSVVLSDSVILSFFPPSFSFPASFFFLSYVHLSPFPASFFFLSYLPLSPFPDSLFLPFLPPSSSFPPSLFLSFLPPSFSFTASLFLPFLPHIPSPSLLPSSTLFTLPFPPFVFLLPINYEYYIGISTYRTRTYFKDIE